jgi:transposase-like protein
MASSTPAGEPDSHSSRRFSPGEKYAAVHRLLRGEEPNRIAAEMHTSTDRLRRWERVFLEGGRQSLEAHHDHGSHSRRMARAARRAAPWAGLILLLIVIVYFASQFLQQGMEP